MKETVEAMSKAASPPIQRGSARAQAIALLVMGAICIFFALLLHPENQWDLLALGAGLGIAYFFDPRHLFIPALLITPLGVVNVLWQYQLVPGAWLESLHLIVLGLAATVILLAARQRRLGVGANPISPGILVLLLGMALLLVSASGGISNFVFSLWLPALVFLAVGGYRLLRRDESLPA